MIISKDVLIALNELLTIRRDFLPRTRRVHEGSVLNLVVDVFIFVERECAA